MDSNSQSELEASPLYFSFQWLKPKENDIHSKSYCQCAILEFLRKCRLYISSASRQKLQADPLWKTFLETLKVITALEIMQAPPLRDSLASLWSLFFVDAGLPTILTGVSWLMDQTRKLDGQSQATVFIECLGQVFLNHPKSLVAMRGECFSILLKFPQQAGNNSAIMVASNLLTRLISLDPSIIKPHITVTIEKVAVPMIESSSAGMRINGMKLLDNIFRMGSVPLNILLRRRIKSTVEALLVHDHPAVRNAAFSLMSQMVRFSGDGKEKSTAKVVENLVKFSTQFGWTMSNELIATFIRNHYNSSEPVVGLLLNLLGEKGRRISLVSSKLAINNWAMEPRQLEHLLTKLNFLTEDTLHEIAIHLMETARVEVRMVVQDWYCNVLVRTKKLPRDVDNLFASHLFHAKPGLAAQACRMVVGQDPPSRNRMIAHLFAEIKGEVIMSDSRQEGLVINPNKNDVLGLCLATLLQDMIEDTTFPAPLYRCSELEELIWDWSKTILIGERKEFETAAFAIVGSISDTKDRLVFLDGLLAERPPNENTSTLDLPPLIGLIHCRHLQHLPSISKFLALQWRKVVSLLDSSQNTDSTHASLLLLCNATLKSFDAGLDVGDVVGNTVARALCQINYPSDLLSILRTLLFRHIRSCSLSSLRYYLSQFNIFSKDPSCRTVIFETLLDLVDILKIRKLEKEDYRFAVGIFKDVFFPFVCDLNPQKQASGAIALGRLVRFVDTREFRDGMLQELIDRALNERDEQFRRGYVLGLGEVYVAMAERGSNIDFSLIIGLLSSLAKDQRSLVVQTAAVEAIGRVLEAQSNSEGRFFVDDAVFLLWNLFCTDFNSTINDRAIENDMRRPLMCAIRLLLDAVGPECLPESSRAKNTLAMAFYLGSCFNNVDEATLECAVEIWTQVLLLCRKIDDIKGVLALIRASLKSSSQISKTKSLTLLKWLLYYMSDPVKEFIDARLISSLLNSARESEELVFCFDAIMERDPKIFLEFIGGSNAGSGLVKAISRVDLNDATLLKSNDSAPSLSPIGESRGLNDCWIQCLLSLATKWFGRLVLDSTKVSPLVSVVDGLVRLVLNLLISETALQATKLASINLMTMILCCCSKWKDPLDERSYLLDTFVSQIATIYSTACSCFDPLVSATSYEGLLRAVFGCAAHLQLRRHSKISQLVVKATHQVDCKPPLDEPQSLMLYSRMKIISGLLQLDHSLCNSFNDKLELSRTRVFRELAELRLENQDIHPLLLNQIPYIITRDLQDKTTALQSAWLMLQSTPTHEYFLAILNMAPALVPGKLKSALVQRLILCDFDAKVACDILDNHAILANFLSEADSAIIIKKSVSILTKTPTLAQLKSLWTFVARHHNFFPCLLFSLGEYYSANYCHNVDLFFVALADWLPLLEAFPKDPKDILCEIASIVEPSQLWKLLSVLGPHLIAIPLTVETLAIAQLRGLFSKDIDAAIIAWKSLAKFTVYQHIIISTIDLVAGKVELSCISLPAGLEKDCIMALLALS